MPMYEYACVEHGVFEAHRTMGECAAPGICPECGGDAARILSVTGLRTVDAPTRMAHERNEKSRHEPRLAGSASGTEAVRSAGKVGCSSQGSGVSRPWALGHG
jgi:putative FmdB family regulatory protein